MEERLRRYELVAIIAPTIPDDELPDAIDRLLKKPVENQGGICDEVNVWGRRRMAYPIKKHTEGNYVLTNIQLDPAKTRELEQGLLISEEVIRHLLVNLDGEG
jgi:small subunit ribosomal protein S6